MSSFFLNVLYIKNILLLEDESDFFETDSRLVCFFFDFEDFSVLILKIEDLLWLKFATFNWRFSVLHNLFNAELLFCMLKTKNIEL